MLLDGKVVIVSGVGPGLGQANARALAEGLQAVIAEILREGAGNDRWLLFRMLAKDLFSEMMTHLMLEGATLLAGGASTDRPWQVEGSDVVVVGRDVVLTDRVWSSRSGYPRGADYRDFHDVEPGSGLRPSRVTDVASAVKASQPHGVEPASGVHVIPYALVPASEDEKHCAKT